MDRIEQPKAKEEKLLKFYTAFVILMRDSVTGKTRPFHCTHKYLGQQSPANMRQVVKICSEYFEVTAFQKAATFPLCIFNKEAMFGPDQNIRVLRSFIHPDNFFPDLREQLSGFRKEDFEYRPHITVENPMHKEINGTFHCYAIMSGQEKIYWYAPNLKSEHVNVKKA